MTLSLVDTRNRPCLINWDRVIAAFPADHEGREVVRLHLGGAESVVVDLTLNQLTERLRLQGAF